MNIEHRIHRNLASVAVFVAAGLAAFIVGNPGLVSAAHWRRESATACTVLSGGSLDFSGDVVANSSGGSTMTLVCPLPDESTSSGDGTYPVTTITSTGSVTPKCHDYNSSASVTVAACTTYSAGGTPGGACDTTFSTGGGFTGECSGTLTTSSVWTSTSDYAYIYVTLPTSSGGESEVRGFLITD